MLSCTDHLLNEGVYIYIYSSICTEFSLERNTVKKCQKELQKEKNISLVQCEISITCISIF